MIAVERITPEQLLTFRVEWNNLLLKSGLMSPMLSWEWLFSWWEFYNNSKVHRDLIVLVARSANGVVVGITPFVSRRYSRLGINFQRIEFMGTGEAEEDETCSEFMDVIIDPQYREEVLTAFCDHIAGDIDWDDIMLKDVRADIPSNSGKLALLLKTKHNIFSSEFGEAVCPCIALPEKWQDYLDSLSSKRAKRIMYERRHFAKAAKLEFRTLQRPDEVDQALTTFIALHQKLWTGRGRPGCFASEVFRNFLAATTRRMSEGNRVRLSCLKADGDTIAVFLLFKQGNALYYYNSGMDPDRFQQFSPGNVCLGYIIEEAIREGLKEFHFFKGKPDSYKSHWTDNSVPVVSLKCQRVSRKQQMIKTVDDCINCLR